MDTKGWLEQLLASGKELAGQGRDFAEEKLNLPEDEPQRAAAVGGLKKGAPSAASWRCCWEPARGAAWLDRWQIWHARRAGHRGLQGLQEATSKAPRRG